VRSYRSGRQAALQLRLPAHYTNVGPQEAVELLSDDSSASSDDGGDGARSSADLLVKQRSARLCASAPPALPAAQRAASARACRARAPLLEVEPPLPRRRSCVLWRAAAGDGVVRAAAAAQR
jgi:hypothetical protein